MAKEREGNRLKHAPYSRFKGFLAENKLKQKQIAELLNLSPVTINQKINGNLDFTFSEVEAICDAFDISPDIFRAKKVAS